MRHISSDIVVVGAGPAGSLAAKTAAENDVHVLLLEEHPRVGQPVHCAEGLSQQGIADAGLEPKLPIVSQEIQKARIYAPDKNYIELGSTKLGGFILNRDAFDIALAEKAVMAGAELRTSTKVTDVIRVGDKIVGVRALDNDGTLEIRSKVVIGADGQASVVRTRSGFRRWFPDVIPCAQYRLGGLNIEDPEINECHLGREIAPGGYAWVFPKSSEEANVGLGVRKYNVGPPIDYLRKFVDSDPRFRGAEIRLINGGLCPISGTIERIVDNGVMLAGDAAGQLIPMTGAGIHLAIIAGRMAGEVAAEAVVEGNASAVRLQRYAHMFNASWGRRIEDSRKMVEMFDRFEDRDLNTLAKIISSEDILNLANGTNVGRTLTRLVSRAPLGILRLMRAYLR
ncbi:NAD(P)/FAD-dependent oxidoreductase [Candidatus Bathyarchaeota archaeon]|nr:NAD(P)/FAD-dependent oxidoreductase [Candidatus Bathyarchaeota archaeon]